jgi:hypothetical protein
VDRQRPQPSGALRRRFARNLGQRLQMGRVSLNVFTQILQIHLTI